MHTGYLLYRNTAALNSVNTTATNHQEHLNTSITMPLAIVTVLEKTGAISSVKCVIHVKPTWNALAERNSLDHGVFEKATWAFLGFVLGQNFDLVISMNKSREFGGRI